MENLKEGLAGEMQEGETTEVMKEFLLVDDSDGLPFVGYSLGGSHLVFEVYGQDDVYGRSSGLARKGGSQYAHLVHWHLFQSSAPYTPL
jgi:hypothetical protein